MTAISSFNQDVSGVLIEGSDYAGKSTVAQLLADRLRLEGASVGARKCYVSNSPVVHFLDEEARRHDDLLIRDKYYSAAMVCDIESMLTSSIPAGFHVQERHWISQLGRNLFFHPSLELIPEGYLERKHLTFGTQVLLYSNVASKTRRCGSRPPSSPRDRLLLQDAGLHQAYDEFIKSLLPAEEQWSIIDTSDASPEEVAAEIYRQLKLAGQAARQAFA